MLVGYKFSLALPCVFGSDVICEAHPIPAIYHIIMYCVNFVTEQFYAAIFLSGVWYIDD